MAKAVQEIKRFPVTGGFEFVGDKQAGGRYDSWTNLAERGIYGYDYDLYEDCGYKLLTVPERPIQIIAELIPWVRQIPLFPGEFGRNAVAIESLPIMQWKPR